MIVTTSRYASDFTRDYAKKIEGRYTARGKKTVDELVETAWKQGHEKILIVEEKESKPGFLSEVLIDHWGNWKWGEKSAI